MERFAQTSRPGARRSPWDAASAVLFAAVAALVCARFRDYGVSWDEPFQREYGIRTLRFLASLGADRSVLALDPLQYYGGLFDALVQLATPLFPFREFETRHLLTAATGVLGAAGAHQLARQLGGPAAGFWSAALLFAIPSWTGHMFVNPKDVPFATGTIWSLHLLARLCARLPDPPTALLLALGLAIGATCGVRIGGAILVADLALLLLAHAVWTRARGGSAPTASGAGLAGVPLVVLPVAAGVALAFWPAALLAPLSMPMAALAKTTRSVWGGAVLFRGERIPGAEIPWDYLPVSLAIKLPEPHLLLLAGALPWLALETWRCARRPAPAALLQRAVLWLAVLPPAAAAVLGGSVHYDGIRHFLFLLPPLACIAGLATARGLARLGRRSRGAQAAATAALGLALAAPALAMARLHPYQYVFYNALVGGPAGAAGRFELDYWATSHKEAVQKLIAHLAGEAGGASAPPRRHRVHVCQGAATALPYLPRDLEPTGDPARADFTIALARWSCLERAGGTVIASVERAGATLAVVTDLRKR